jgi:hypothetical protein
MKKVYVVNTCNVWKTYDSFSLVGIFTSRKKLNPVLNRLLKQKDIAWSDETFTSPKADRAVNGFSDRELLDHLDYIFIELVTLNEVQ